MTESCIDQMNEDLGALLRALARGGNGAATGAMERACVRLQAAIDAVKGPEKGMTRVWINVYHHQAAERLVVAGYTHVSEESARSNARNFHYHHVATVMVDVPFAQAPVVTGKVVT